MDEEFQSISISTDVFLMRLQLMVNNAIIF